MRAKNTWREFAVVPIVYLIRPLIIQYAPTFETGKKEVCKIRRIGVQSWLNAVQFFK